MKTHSPFTKYFIQNILDRVQNLEDIGGPNTLAEYIFVLEAVKSDIEQRLANAKARVVTESNLVPLPEFGCFVTLNDGVLFSCPMDEQGGPDEEDACEVTAPQSQAFLDAVNFIFNTDFQLKQFSGR